MKKILVSLFLLIFSLCLVGCVDTPNGPHTTVPYGIYDNSLMMSQYPYQVTQNINSNEPKFEVIVPIPGVIGQPLYPKFPDVISLDYIKCDNLQELFNTDVSEDYLRENFKAIWFIREEPITTDALEDIVYLDLFVENFEVYVTVNYNSVDEGGEAFSTYEELILIPNEWEGKIGKSPVNFNFYNHIYLGTKMTMSYNKMQEFKDAYRKQVLDKKYDDQMYREIYMLDVYGEYGDCLVATVTYDGYVHTDIYIPLTETFGDISITYDAHYPIWVCYNGALYTLTQAYNNGYLTIDDIKQIFAKNAYYIFGHTHDYIDGLCDCGEFDSVWLNENFRLSDEQILFKGSVDDEFNCDVILLTLKHTTTYIELSKRHFKLDEITEVVYISSTPPSHFYEPGNEDKLNNFHQIVFLYVDVETKEEIIELIIELEKLPFVESVGPNSIEHGE